MGYVNEQFELLYKNREIFNSSELNNILDNIKNFYDKFNRDFSRYSDKYIVVIEDALENFPVENYIYEDLGGKAKREYNTIEFCLGNILNLVQTYWDRICSLRYLEFLSDEKRNVVFVGPNGCGKTTLLRKLISSTGENNIGYYQADRLLIINENYTPERDEHKFINTLNNNTRYATDVNNSYQSNYIVKQFDEIVALFEKERSRELELYYNEKIDKKDVQTEIIMDTWNYLIMDRSLFTSSTLRVKTLSGDEYPIKYLSSGEKNIFYFLASILLQEEKMYYFIDEPENNLNPAAVSKLWNIIEKQRPDSIFVYLTHDKEFVASRINAKVYWIKKYDGKDWEYESLPTNDDLPQELVVSLVGNKKPVLFCESENEGKYDYQLLSLMFPSFKIIPAGGCSKVIAKIKAYKSLKFPQKAYGIIDCDYRKQDFLDGAKHNNIYNFNFFEIENMLFCDEILKAFVAKQCDGNNEIVTNIENEVIKDFVNTREIFIIRSVANRLRELSYSGKINSMTKREELINEYNEEINPEKPNDLFEQYEKLFDEVVARHDYNEVLRYYDCKKIMSKYNDFFGFTDGIKYQERIIPFLKENPQLVNDIRNKYLSQIIE